MNRFLFSLLLSIPFYSYSQVKNCDLYYKIDTVSGNFLWENHYLFNKKSTDYYTREFLIQYDPKKELINLYKQGVYYIGMNSYTRYVNNLGRCNHAFFKKLATNLIDSTINFPYGPGYFSKKFSKVKKKNISYQYNCGRLRYKVLNVRFLRIYMGHFYLKICDRTNVASSSDTDVEVPVYYIVNIF